MTKPCFTAFAVISLLLLTSLVTAQPTFGSEPQVSIYSENFDPSETLLTDYELWSAPGPSDNPPGDAVSTPGQWELKFVDGENVLQQSRNVFDNYIENPPVNTEVGTIAAFIPGRIWQDFTFTARFMSGDDDVLGVVFRHVDENNYYEFHWGADPFLEPSQPIERRIRRVCNGNFTDLALEIGTPYVIGRWYQVKVEVFHKRINVYLFDEVVDSDFVLWQTVEDSLLCNPVGTIGASSIANDQAYFDQFDVTVPYEALAALSAVDRQRSGSVTLGNSVMVDRIIGSQTYSVSSGIVSTYQLTIPAELAGQVLQLRSLLTGSSPECCVHLYISADAVPLTNNFDYAATSTRTKYNSITVPNVQAGTYYIRLVVDGDVDTATFDIDWAFEVVDAEDIDFETPVVKTGVSVNTWRFFRLPVLETYTGLTFTVTPSPLSATPYLRAVTARNAFPSLTLGDYTQLVTAPNGAGSYVVTESNPALNTFYLGVFVATDPDPASGTPVEPLALADFTLVVLPAAPSLFSLTPVTGNTIGAYSLFIRGSNVGGNNYAGSTTVLFGGEPCDSQSFTEVQGEIDCVIPSGQGPNIEVTVTHFGQTSPDPLFFSFKAPSLFAISPATADTAGGSELVLSGTNFGTNRTVTVGGLDCPVVPLPQNPTQEDIDGQHSVLTCLTPRGQGVDKEVIVTVSGLVSTQQRLLDYNQPRLDSISPVTGPTAGNTIMTLRGNNFGSSGEITIGSDTDKCTDSATLGHNDTVILCRLPPGQGAGHDVTVTISSQDSNTIPFSYDKPAITSIDPEEGPTDGNFALTIYGTDFGTSGTVFVNGISGVCVQLAYFDTNITCTFPEGQGVGKTIRVSVTGQLSNIVTFDYAAPTLDRMVPAAGPAKGGTRVALYGSNFGSDATVNFPTGECTALTQNHTVILCTAPAGSGSLNNVTVSVDSLTSGFVNFAYDSPVVDQVAPANGPTVGSSLIVITGSNFGSSGAGLVTIDGKACTSVLSQYRDDRIVCSTPAGQGVGLDVVVTLNGQESSVAQFSYDAPNITKIEPTVVPTGGENTLLTITGENFGTTEVVPVVTILLPDGEVDCPLTAGTRGQPHTTIVCVLPEGSGQDVSVRVNVSGQAFDSATKISFAPPSISSAATSVPAYTDSQETLTILGSSFGTDGNVTVGGEPCVNTLWTHKEIRCTLPVGQGENQPVYVEFDGQRNEPAFEFDYVAPVVSAATPVEVPTVGGTVLEITGLSFGTSGSVEVDGRPCPQAPGTDWGHRAIYCVVPSGQGTAKSVVVTVGMQPSNNNVRINYGRPVIAELDPETGSTQGGYNLTVRGSSFGNEGDVSVFIGTTACEVLKQNHSEIVCVVPAGEGSRGVLVTVAERDSSSQVQFTYAAPSFTSVTPETGRTVGGAEVLIVGDSFGLRGSVSIGLFACAETVPRTHTQIRCSVPPGQGEDLDITVVVRTAGGVTTATSIFPDAFSYNAPTVTSVQPLTGPTDGQIPIVIRGFSFGDDDLALSAAGGEVTIGGALCEFDENDPTAYNHTEITCSLPAGQGLLRPLIVTVGGTRQTDPVFFNYSGPSVTGVLGPLGESQGGSTAGGDRITVQGSNFGSSGQVTVGGAECDITSYTSSQIICTIPEGQGTNVSVIVTVASQVSQRIGYRYAAPTISVTNGITPSEAATDAGTQGETLTIRGTNFGTNGSVTVGGLPCVFADGVSFYSHQRIECVIPDGEGDELDVVVTVSGTDEQQVTAASAFSYSSPTVSTVSPIRLFTNGSNVVQISGSNFGSPTANVVVKIGGAVCAALDPEVRTHSSIQCQAPAGVGTGLDVSVQVETLETIKTNAASYSAPTLTRLEGDLPCTLASNGLDLIECPKASSSTKLTLFGANFGSDEISASAKANITIEDENGDPVQCLDVQHAAGLAGHQQVTCTLPDERGFSRELRLIVGGQTSNARLVSFAGPVVTPNTLRFSGDAVPSDGAESLDLVIPADDTQGVNGGQLVQFDGKFLQISGGATPHVYYGPAGGDKFYNCTGVTVSGDCDTLCTIQCALAPGAGTDLRFVVFDGEQTSPESDDTLSYPQPIVDPNSITNPEVNEPKLKLVGTATQGETIYISATNVYNFTNDVINDRLRIFYGPDDEPKKFECQQIENRLYNFETKSTNLSCRTVPGEGSNLRFIIQAVGYDSERSQVLFSYPDAPVITKIEGCPTDLPELNSTTNCPTKGGVVITITGTELAATSSVRVGSADCTNVRSESSGTDKLSCLLPAGVGDPSSVVVFNGLAFFSRTSQLLSYARPQLSYMIGCDEEGPSISGCSRNGGETIVIVGTNFGEGVATVIIGGSLCEGVVHSTTAQHEELSCQLPKGTQLDRSVLVVQDQGELSSNTLSLSYEPCAAGTFSASDTDYNCTDCPAGKFGAAGSCTDCPSGRFTEEAGRTECDGCPRGKFSVGTACEPCGVGTFNQAVAQEECTPCPRGTYGPTTGRDVECLPCPLGRFTGDEGQTECQNCTAGEIAGSTRSTECVACNPGFFAQNASASVCEPCPAGTAAPLPGASECGECIPGRASSATGQSNCLPCDSGTFSDGFGEKSCEDCPVGKFSEQGSDASIGPTSCTPCPTSFFASQTGRQQCTPCPAGRFGDEEGLSECFPCLTGTKQNEAQRSECDPCEPGSFTAVNGSQTCTLCARGRYQPDGGKSECIACEPGKTQPNPGETDCLPCDPGTASNAEGQKRDTCPSCEDGSIATGEGETSCTRCPAGFKAFLGISCEPCELGTFSSFEAQIECEPCPAGRFGNQLNLTQCEVCPAGKSSAEGALTCSGCPPGRFSEFDGTEDECRECGIGRFSNVWNSTTCDACPEGKSQSAEGQSDCDECDVGFFNTATGQQFCDECLPGRYSNVSETVDCILCEPGRYQPSQQQSECLPCPVGRFTSASGQDECQACSPGTFCAVEGLSTPTPCPPGQFSDAAVNIECTNCTAGRFTDSFGTAGVSGLNDCSACDVGRFNDQPGLDRCFDCPIGTRQPGTGLQACIECEAGKFQSATGQSECIVCPAGSITDTKRQSSCRECPAGTAAQGGLTCEDCDPGFFSSSNRSIVCTGCRSGRFSEESGATECTECPAGKKQSGIEADECEKCPTGRFGLTTGQSDCEACPAGRFANVTGLKECIECPIGKSGPGTGRRTCEVCTAGRFNQLPGQRDCQDCDPGTFSAEDGATDCEACPAGKAAQSQGSSECAPCGPGVFSAAPGALTCSPCDVGTFSNGTTNTECTKCSPGYEQPLSRSSKCLLCSPGTFAKFAGLQSCEDCPAGTFSAGDGAIECEDCEPGKFAGGEGLTECAKCPVGRAIGVSGQDECSRCTQGTFANRTGLAECLECPAGRAVNAIGRDTECPLCDATRFQSTPGQALCKLCPVGRAGGRQGLVECGLCQPGSFTDESGQLGCVLCPAGRFGNVEGARSCSPCPEGSFSTGEGNTECTPCDPGSFQDGEGEETCLQCPVGKFSVGSGAVSCSLCPRGSASPINGTNTLCPLCEPGKKAEQPGLGECTLCEAGKFADGTGRSTCDLCSPGTASDKPGSTEGCPACTAGKFQSFEGRTTCQPCPRGRFTNSTRTDVCSACDAGKYQDEEGQEQCVSCPRGKATARTGSTTDCQFCEPGRFTDVTGREECDFCDPGQVANVSGLFECKRCDVGRFQSRSGEEECEACPRGRFAAVPGLSLCAECPQGQYGNETNLISCLPCEPGTKSSSSGQTECEPCEVGKFSSGEGAKQCLPCDPGESSPTPGAVRCTLCDPGRFQNERESETCKACPQGKFTSDRGRIECQDCASGEFTNTTGQSECTRCQPGEYSLLTACAPCPRGRFSALVIGTTCQPCGSGDFANVTGLSSCHECFAGFKTGDTLAAENCTTCEAGTSSNPGSVVCQVCDPGKFSNPVGLPYQCSDCPLNAAARPGVVNGVSRAGNTECVCNAGFFFDEAWRGVGGSELSCRECCRPCDEGADCSEAGRSFATLPARTGYWRASRFRATCPADNFDRSHACRSPPSFYRCLIRDHCPSTAVTALTGVFNVSNQCGGNRDGPICAVCEKGYHSPTTTGDCQECPENNTNAWVFTIIVTSVIVLCIIFMYWVVLKTDRNLSREAKERHHAHRENEWTWFEEDTANVTKSIHDKERVKYGAAPTALPNFTYKMKIVLGFFQITVNLAFALDIPWPSRYQSFISAFGLVNFDLIQWSSVGCVVEANFYHKFVAITVTPIIVLVLVFLFFLVPRYLRHVRDEEDYDLRRLARQRSNRKFWKLFLFTLFLIYPGVSSTVLRLYVCRDIEGVDYLLADFNIKCSGDTYDFFKQFNVIFIMLYPLGIPAFFFAMLYKNRDKLNLPDVRVQLGFLTDAYESVLWWFELVDMLNKLILTSLLAFVPRDFQLEMGCLFAVLYLIVLLLMRPYLRKGDDRLHLFAQTEIFLILLAGLVFVRIDSEDLDDGSDIIMSVILVSLTLGFLLYFFGQVGYILKKMWERSQAERRRKLEDDEQGVQLAPGVTQMRLPKNALMVRNPLFDNDSSSRMNDPMALETGGQWEGSQSEGSYFSEDSSVSSLTSGYSDAGRDDAPQEGLKRPQSEETLMPEVAGMNEIETPDNSDYNDSSDAGDEPFKTEFAPRQIRRG